MLSAKFNVTCPDCERTDYMRLIEDGDLRGGSGIKRTIRCMNCTWLLDLYYGEDAVETFYEKTTGDSNE